MSFSLILATSYEEALIPLISSKYSLFSLECYQIIISTRVRSQFKRTTLFIILNQARDTIPLAELQTFDLSYRSIS